MDAGMHTCSICITIMHNTYYTVGVTYVVYTIIPLYALCGIRDTRSTTGMP